MKAAYLVSTKKPGLEFRVLKRTVRDDGSLTVVLLGSHGVKFERTINDDILTKYGYVVQIREEADDAVQPQLQA